MDPQEDELYRAILVAALSFSLILVGFIAWVIFRLRRHMRLQRQLFVAELNSQERERARIANDLHDELSPKLAAIKIAVNQLELSNKDDQDLQKSTNDIIDGLSSDLRGISYDLMPATLQKKGFVDAVKELCNYVSRSSPLKISANLPPGLAVTSEVSIHLYRIVQEIVHNALKHAHASQLSIAVSVNVGGLILKAIDNGVGFDDSAKGDSRGGLGLQSIRSRVVVLNGEIEILGEKGKGTKIVIHIPI